MADNIPDAELAAPYVEGLSGDINPVFFFANHAAALVLVTVLLAVRLYVRKFMVKAMGKDDYLLIAAYFVFLGQTLFMFYYAAELVRNGLAAEYFNSIIRIQFWGVLYLTILVLVRIAIAAFFLRVLPAPAFNWQRYTIIISVGLYTLFSIIYNFVQLFSCGDPLDVRNPDPKCLDLDAMNALALVSTILNMLIDWLLTLLPATVIYKSSMSWRNKCQVMAVMMLGAVGSIISIVRIPFLDLGILVGEHQWANLSTYFVLALWENSVAMAAISAAALKPLMRKWFPSDSTLGTSNAPLTMQPDLLPPDVENDSLEKSGEKEKDVIAVVHQLDSTEEKF
ncbi:hypothetical protein BDZ85DRAFT_246696 [Elsinoe ampelina]|uniref:Rhodopsin domain-containing protein n=1 Tax=Elsinoe ampelina TaxID=302913 RepID=A0A6A6GSJ4_9PEZI|nr:hypothetical protein BDZ85DRAFT_246696 [Elsinoe ampelina]